MEPASRYTMRLTWPDFDRPHDFVFRVGGRDAGRCYQMAAAFQRTVWLWTVYGEQDNGMENKLAEAQANFKAAVEARKSPPVIQK